MKITKIFLGFISALAILLSSSVTSFAKVVGDKIILGSAISLTGKYSSNGVHTQNGYNMAVDRINSMGGIKVGGKTYKFEIIYYDDESNPKRAAQLAERLISQDGVEFMLGPYSSGLTKAIAPVTEKYGVPMVEANGASRSLFTKGYKYLFAVLAPANLYLDVAIDLAVEKNGGKPVKIAQAFEQDAFSQDVRLGILEAAERTGSKIIIDDKLPKELNDMAATLAKVKTVKPDVLVVSGHTKGALTAIRQIAEMKVDVPMLAMTHCDAAKLSKQHGKNSEFALCASQWHKSLTYKDDFFGNGMKYAADFQKEFGYDPPYQSAESSAALLVFKDAFERANSFDKKKVRDALADTNMQTFYGNIKFAPGGQNVDKPMVLFQVMCNDDGSKCENKVVAPTKWASAELIHPIPKWSER
ncbi:MAG: amino acid ABC transporter substrate-binding protein [Proteobacteria bacterium]|nr:MAG: amino acid ABC transporter substrate-binding protein [Pseudomonadota bacterium]